MKFKCIVFVSRQKLRSLDWVFGLPTKACLFSSRAALQFSACIWASALFWKSHFKRLCEMDVPILNWARSCIKIACYKLSRHTFLPFLPLFLFHSSSLSEREEIYVPSRHNKKEKQGRAGKTWAGQTLSFCCTFWVWVSMNQIIIEAAVTQAKQTGMQTFFRPRRKQLRTINTFIYVS